MLGLTTNLWRIRITKRAIKWSFSVFIWSFNKHVVHTYKYCQGDPYLCIQRCVINKQQNNPSILSPGQLVIHSVSEIFFISILYLTYSIIIYGLQSPVFERLIRNQKQKLKFGSMLLLSSKMISIYFSTFFDTNSYTALSTVNYMQHTHDMKQKIKEFGFVYQHIVIILIII